MSDFWTEFFRALVCLPPSRSRSSTRYVYTTRSSYRPSEVSEYKPHRHSHHHHHSSSSGGTTTTIRYRSKERTRPRTRTVDSGYSEGVVDFTSSRR